MTDASNLELAEKRAFNHGYLIAVANIQHLHNEDTIAEDVFRELGSSTAEVRSLDLTEYDMEVLTPLLAEIDRKDGLALEGQLA
jgi:hypothetical protein